MSIIEFSDNGNIEGEGFRIVPDTEKYKMQESDPSEQTNLSDTDQAASLWSELLTNTNSYSETLKFKDDGSFDTLKRYDGSAYRMPWVESPEQLYQLARLVQQKFPEIKFNFKSDPERKWFKYTVFR